MSAPQIGRFEILSELGRGGQGTVYLARDTQLDRKVAIKTLRKFGHQTEQLTHEALIVSKLQHPNIITLFDAGEHDAKPYLVYAFIEGKTLAQVLTEEKKLPLARAAEIASDALRGLVYAHEQGISHLDIKPANIMIAKNGLAMVMDFGLATTSNTDEQTATGIINGSPRYVAPEVVSGQAAGPLADVYAIGAVLYEMVTGQYAVPGSNTFEVLNRAAHEQVIPPSTLNEQVDETLEAIILNALKKNPAERYPSSASMLQDLDDYLDEARNATTEFLLQRMRSKQDFPAISSVISEINQIVETESDSSRLVSVILQDFALTNKLLRLVNTASFSQFGGGINTISKAIVVLGFETVRNIAATLILLEFLQNKPQAEQLKDEIVKAVLAGDLAAQLLSGNDSQNAEEILICAMFHNLGKMLALFYFYEESQEIARLVDEGESERIASARILGIPYTELGISVTRSWNFPPRLIAGMRQLTATTIAPPQNELEQLTASINLAYDLCDISSTGNLEKKQEQLAELTARYANACKLSEHELSATLDTSLNEIKNRSSTLGVSTANSPLLARVRRWCSHTLLPSSLPSSPETGSADGKDRERLELDKGIESMADLAQSVAQKYSDEESLVLSHNPEEILGAGVQEVTDTMMGEFNLNALLQMVLETIYRGMKFKRAMFMLRNVHEMEMIARFGFGPGIVKMLPDFRFTLHFVPDVFHLSIEKGLDISIENIRAPN
ncbi:MAG TPA: protein kinase, partial [Gallionella sp.]|nr:protein kinase [Gallionella sp.]